VIAHVLGVGRRGAGQDGGVGFGLKVAPADLVVDLPVFVLAERAAVASHVTAAARLVGRTPAVPAHLFQISPN